MNWSVKRSLGTVASRAFGPLPAREYAYRVRRGLTTLRLHVGQKREVAVARRSLRNLPAAEIVTVIATFERPELLLRAVRSALAQPVGDHAVVVVDDAGGLPLLPDDPRITTISLRRHWGSPSLARNVGVRCTRSRILAFLDDDNTWEPDHLSSALDAIGNGADLAYTGMRWVDRDDQLLGVLSIDFDRELLRAGNMVDTSTVVMRRSRHARFSLVPRHRGDATYEDWEIAWRVARRRRVVHVPTITANVTVHSGSHFSLPDGARVPTSVRRMQPTARD